MLNQFEMNRVILLRRFSLMAASWLVFTAGGCNEIPTGDIVPTAPAAGTATYQGKPLEYFQVRFISEGETRPAAGVTDQEGRFTLGTNTVGDGAPAGTYRVAVSYVGPPPSPDYGVSDFTPLPPPNVKLPKKYEDPQQSGLQVVVPEGGKTDIVIHLE